VDCPSDNSTVTSLQLPYQLDTMRGSIPASFSALTGLTLLNLGGSLYQPFPDFSALTRLQTLILTNQNVRNVVALG
jgi:hypothetical protein